MTDAELIAAIEDMRADRKRCYDVGGDGIDALFAKAATRLSVMREALEEIRDHSDCALAQYEARAALGEK